MCVRLEAASCLGSHCQMPSTSLRRSVGRLRLAFDAPNCQVYIHTYWKCICLCVCRIICSSGALCFLGQSRRLIDCSKLATMMMMIGNSFWAVGKTRSNSRVIKLFFHRSVAHVTFLYARFFHFFPLSFSLAVSLGSVIFCERAHLHFEPLCQCAFFLIIAATAGPQRGLQ